MQGALRAATSGPSIVVSGGAILGPLGSNYPIELAFQRVSHRSDLPPTVPAALLDACRDCGAPDPRASIDGDPLCDASPTGEFRSKPAIPSCPTLRLRLS